MVDEFPGAVNDISGSNEADTLQYFCDFGNHTLHQLGAHDDMVHHGDRVKRRGSGFRTESIQFTHAGERPSADDHSTNMHPPFAR